MSRRRVAYPYCPTLRRATRRVTSRAPAGSPRAVRLDVATGVKTPRAWRCARPGGPGKHSDVLPLCRAQPAATRGNPPPCHACLRTTPSGKDHPGSGCAQVPDRLQGPLPHVGHLRHQTIDPAAAAPSPSRRISPTRKVTQPAPKSDLVTYADAVDGGPTGPAPMLRACGDGAVVPQCAPPSSATAAPGQPVRRRPF